MNKAALESEWLTGYICGVVLGVGIGRWWSLSNDKKNVGPTAKAQATLKNACAGQCSRKETS